MEEELLHASACAFIEENYKTCLDQLAKCIEKNNKCAQAFQMRGCVQLKLGEFASAISDFNKAEFFLGNHNFSILYNRIKAFICLQDVRSAKDELKKAEQLQGLSNEEKQALKVLSQKIG
jgi:tetratricopeptide (TPR) repeat protein